MNSPSVAAGQRRQGRERPIAPREDERRADASRAGHPRASTRPIGVVTVLLSYLIGLAVCLHLGAVAGRMWNERGPRAADPSEVLAGPDR